MGIVLTPFFFQYMRLLKIAKEKVFSPLLSCKHEMKFYPDVKGPCCEEGSWQKQVSHTVLL